MKLYQVILAASVLSYTACNTLGGGSSSSESSLPKGTKFIEPSFIDSSVRAQDDFYTYAGGNWLKKNQIPASETRWGSFNLLEDFNKNALKGLVEAAAAKTGSKKGTPEQMVGDLYASGMDTVTIEKAGIGAIKTDFDRIATIKDATGLWDELAKQTAEGGNPLFGFYVGPDDKNVTKNMCNLFQGGLGMPDRDYYIKTDERNAKLKAAYIQHVKTMMVLAGEDEATATKSATTVVGLETELAKVSMDRVAMRDPYNIYHKLPLSEVNKLTPGVEWKALLAKMLVLNEDTLLVAQPNFFKAVAAMIKTKPIDDWKTYMKWHSLNGASTYLSKSFDQEHFNFFGKTLRGQQEQKPRWKKISGLVDGAVGEQLGKMYTEKYFPAKSKERMMELVNNLSAAYEERIKGLDWMSDSTKTKALEKLHSFIKKIGFPDKWRDYTGLDITRDNLIQNVRNSNAFDYKYMISKLGKPVDKTEWGMTPPTVNAYYNPSFNEIVFPAGILQYPFFNFEADDAAIYGAIGGVIGHEMTHGFDDQGAQYAADGNLKNWWSKEDETKFKAKTKMVVDQFNAYTVMDTMHVNGNLTLGENIADLGGVTIAYAAFKKTKQGQSNEKIDGFTADQRFFLSWAQVWRQNIRDEEQATRIVTDPHSPGIHRCNGPLSNFAPFYTAFNVKEGDKMYKPEVARAKIW
jgi:putative endopeptidase